MSRLIRVSLLGAALTIAGCGAETPELAPKKDTQQFDKSEIEKQMQQSAQRNNQGSGGRSNLDASAGDNKTP
jgi:hypothetical protein